MQTSDVLRVSQLVPAMAGDIDAGKTAEELTLPVPVFPQEVEITPIAPPDDEGLMRVMDETGDYEVKWNRRNHVEVEAARAAFDSMKAKRYMAYKTTASGERGEVITSFDPDAQRIVFTPPMVGG